MKAALTAVQPLQRGSSSGFKAFAQVTCQIFHFQLLFCIFITTNLNTWRLFFKFLPLEVKCAYCVVTTHIYSNYYDETIPSYTNKRATPKLTMRKILETNFSSDRYAFMHVWWLHWFCMQQQIWATHDRYLITKPYKTLHPNKCFFIASYCFPTA